MSRDVHPGWRDALPSASVTLNVTIPRADGTAIQRTFCASVQLASAPASNFSETGKTAVAMGAPDSAPASNKYSLPFPAAATTSLSFHWNTSGEDVKPASGTVAAAFCLS